MKRKRRLQLRTFDEKVTLRELTVQDSTLLFELIEKNRLHLSQFGDQTSKKYPTHLSVRRSITHPKDPSRIRLGIWHAGTIVGSISITAHAVEESVEIGYWVGNEFSGKGIATTAVTAVMHYIFLLRKIKRVVAYAHKDNIASQRVLTKTKLQRIEGEIKGFYCFALDAAGYRRLHKDP